MRKSLIGVGADAESAHSTAQGTWIDLDQHASIEITSEDPNFPVEQAFGDGQGAGWRAAATGPQLIRITFDHPTAIRRIRLHFVERSAERSQEFALYAKHQTGQMNEVVRQQFTFSPRGSTEEIEDYSVDLNEVTSLELRIDPDRAHDPAHSKHFAVLQSLRLA